MRLSDEVMEKMRLRVLDKVFVVRENKEKSLNKEMIVCREKIRSDLRSRSSPSADV